VTTQLRGVNIPVSASGMNAKPDVIHMDQCGACKFPADKLDKVLEYATELLRREAKEKTVFQDPSFSLKEWKATVQADKKIP